MLEQRRHGRVLAAIERPLVLPDHDRIPPAIGVGERGDHGRGLRAARPREYPALPDVKELAHDPPVPGNQRGSLVPLPRQGSDRVLMILRRHPPVEDKPQQAAAFPADPAASGALGPRRQTIPILARSHAFQANVGDP